MRVISRFSIVSLTYKDAHTDRSPDPQYPGWVMADAGQLFRVCGIMEGSMGL